MLRLVTAALLTVALPLHAAVAAPAALPSAAALRTAPSVPGVMPLDATLALIEDQPITSAQVMTRLGLMRAMAQKSTPSADRPLTEAQAYKELFEARLLSWDASRKRIAVSDEEVDRAIELLLVQLGAGGGKPALSALLASYGIDEASYRELCRQDILFAKLDRIGEPVRTRAERLRELEKQALILNVNELLSLTPASKRSCTPAALAPAPAAAPLAPPAGKRSTVAGICLEGERTAPTEARLTQLGRIVQIGSELDRASISRAHARLLWGDDAAEAAAAYAISTEPNESPEKAKSLWVVFRVRERRWLAGVELVGMPAGVSAELPPSDKKMRVSQSALRQLLDSTRDTLQEAGFRSASLKVERLPAAAGTSTVSAPAERVRLLVTPGPRTRITQVELAGANQSRRAELLALLPFRAADPYQETESLAARFKLEHYYQEHGYLRAQIDAPEAVQQPTAGDGSAQVRLRYTIKEGPLCQLATLRFTGELPLAEAELRRLMKSGLNKPVSPDTLRMDLQRMRDAAKSAGKPVQITPNFNLRNEGAQADLTLEFARESAVPAKP